jgi:hypothetical protein
VLCLFVHPHPDRFFSQLIFSQDSIPGQLTTKMNNVGAQVFLRIFRSSPVSIIRPLLHSQHLQLSIILIRTRSGPKPWNLPIQQCSSIYQHHQKDGQFCFVSVFKALPCLCSANKSYRLKTLGRNLRHKAIG